MDKTESKLNTLRHSAAHVLASAVKELYPKVKLGIGPAIENGFYYDFDFGKEAVSEADLAKIEEKMRSIQSRGEVFEKKTVSVEKAKKLFKNQPYKLELINAIAAGEPTDPSSPRHIDNAAASGIKPEKLSVYQHGDFVDLCQGPHLASTADIGPFKLLSIAGAYWRGKEKNPMLTRVYGTAFPTQKELDDYLHRLEEAKKRDHKKLGKELDLYLFSSSVGPGLPIYTPKGTAIIQEIEDFMRQLQTESGYSHVYTPHLAKEDLFQTSGHLQWFAEGMYPPMEFEGEGRYFVKPMNCPFHIQIYQNQPRSYRDLPIRYAEFGTVYRYEKSGEISGLLRTRGFTQDDAHIFCREEQVADEFLQVLKFTDKLLGALGLQDHWHRLSLRGKEKEKYAGNLKQWQKATVLIKQALEKRNINYKEAVGEAAFYGPKLDIIFKDLLGREWQISTIQVDFLLPERFNLSFVDSDGRKKRPFMIHRAPLGSRERILAILLEHHAGAFPVWLSPVQAVVIPVGEKHQKYAEDVAAALCAAYREGRDKVAHLQGANTRIQIDRSSQTLPARIRKAQLQKIPYMLIVGDKEKKLGNTVSLRLRTGQDWGLVKIEEFVRRLAQKIQNREPEL